MDAFSNYLEKLGSNFFVSSMVPSLAFGVTCLIVFDPTLIVLSSFSNLQEVPRLIVLGLLLAIFTVIVGFTLTALNTFILKIFEGYVKPFPIRFAYNFKQRQHLKRARTLIENRDKLENQIRKLRKYVGDDRARQPDLDGLMEQHYKLTADYGLSYPDDLSDVLPSRFGNTLKAAENYPGERYGLDGVHFWPRLVHVIPSEYKLSLDSTRNELSFLVNMSVLSAVFSAVSVLAIFFTMAAVNSAGTNPNIYFVFLSIAGKYFLLAGLGIASCYFFYNASIFSVGSFGLMIRSSYDLFRLDLLKKIGLERPKDSIEEFEIWNQLSEFIVLGGHSLRFKKLDYRKEEEE